MPRRPFERAGTPAVSIVLAVYDPPHSALIAQLDAIAAQTSSDWECVVVDDASTDPVVVALVDEWVSLADHRRLIRRRANGGIAAATNDGIEDARGSILTICDHDDVIHPEAVAAVIEHFESNPNDDVVYTDEQLVDADGLVVADYPKPDYSPRRHLGHHYLAHLVAARRDAIGDLRVRREFEPSQDYDFWLRVIERSSAAGRHVGHIPRALYSWRAITGSSALDAREKPEMCDAVRRCSQAALDRRGIKRVAVIVEHDGRPTTSVMLRPPQPHTPSISFVSIGDHATPKDLNDAAAQTDGEVLCFVPADAAIDETWAAPMAIEALDDVTGAVGPKIISTAGRLASIGRTVQPTLTDAFSGSPADATGPWGAFFVVREVSAVAPQGLTVSRAAFDTVGGFATDIGLDAAAAELCLRLSDAGRATLVHPSVELVADLADLAGVEGVAAVRGRFPESWRERFDAVGTAQHVGTDLNPFEQLHDLLASKRIDLVTSDVFDTVITRPVATPSDLFVVLASRVDLPSHVTPQVFAAGRRAAERRARLDRSTARRRELLDEDPSLPEAELRADPVIAAPEVTLEEIWAHVPATWGDRAALLDAELRLEAEFLRPIPETVESFRRARDLGVPVVLVSDIYLSATQLAEMLDAIGVDMSLVDEVVTSSDHQLGKAHGLLAKVIDGHGVDPGRVAHLGDNELADVDTADRLGAYAVHVDIARSARHVELPPRHLRTWSTSSGTDLGISAAVRSVLVDAGHLGRDPSFQYGAAVVGPALAGFSRWVSETTVTLGASTVHCMLREGATIAELMKVVAPDGATPVPIHVSRWVTMRAAVVEATPEELLTALARRADLTVDHVVAAFECDPERVRRVLGADTVEPGKIVEACTALADDTVLRSQIIDHAGRLRERVLRYLRDRLVFEDGAPLVVADVGWGGTIQEGLTRILRAGGIETEVVGLYLALSAPGEERLARGARMLSYLPNVTDDPDAAVHTRAIAHHADTIERIMTPAIGTLIDIDEDGEPVCRPVSHDPISPTLRAAQRAMRLVVNRLVDDSDISDGRWGEPSLRAALGRTIADAVTAPSRPLAEALGAWPHDDVAGTAHRSIAGAELAAAARYANVRDVDLLDPAGRSWVAGLAGATNPALSAQLAAARSGVALDGLAPESENGMARLAAFEVGSDLAELQVGRAVSVTPAGWSVLRIAGDVASLRSLRFDAGEHAALVDVGHFSVAMSTTQTFDPELRHVELTDDDVIWVDAHPIDARRFAHRPGGHLLIDIDPQLAAAVRSIDVTVAFRCWRLDDEDPLAKTPVARQVADHTRRIAHAVKRRL